MTMPDFMRDPDLLVSRTANLLERGGVSRRGFLTRMTMVGSAMTVAPVRYLMQPMSVLDACCTGSDCPVGCQAGGACTCSSACCTDANSTFCCTLNGSNTCPSGSSPCGSWNCGNTSLIMFDCCAPQGGSLCPADCRCALGSCANRRTCCFPQDWSNCPSNSGVIVCRITHKAFNCEANCGTGMKVPTCTSVPACANSPAC